LKRKAKILTITPRIIKIWQKKKCQQHSFYSTFLFTLKEGYNETKMKKESDYSVFSAQKSDYHPKDGF
jgi:hypothetical protein